MPKHDHHWTFGNRCHIEFPNGGGPVNVPLQPFFTDEGCATISDANGNLLFYTDGRRLYDAAGTIVNPSPQPELGGNFKSCHSAIIVPPAGGGSRYHIFGVKDWETTPSHVGPITYTAVTAGPGNVSIVHGPVPLQFGPQKPGERLAAVSHEDCDKYWVVTLELQGTPTLYAMLIGSDAIPTPGPGMLATTTYPPSTIGAEYRVRFSPDGSLFAVTSQDTIDLLSFDRATGLFSPHSRIVNIANAEWAYDVEFSPNGHYLYFSAYSGGDVRRHKIGAPGTSTQLSATDLISQWPPAQIPVRIGAIQLAPNGKIYGAKPGTNGLFEIGNPDDPTTNAAGVQFLANALHADGSALRLDELNPGAAVAWLGLPTFTRIAIDCVDEDRCATIAAQVEEQISGRDLHNLMRPCRGEPEEPACGPLEMPAIRPQTFIRWGDSPCDCIEGDDTEVMHLTVCNPYSNLTLSNVTVYELVVVDANGNPVPNLPDGSPSIQLVPVGPHCFDDIAPCSCVSREFVLRLRGAPGGPYRILVRGICFDACFHGDTEACFTFEVCKD